MPPYPNNQPLPPGIYYWSLIIAGPGSNGREVRYPCTGNYTVAPGTEVTGIDIHEELRIACARKAGFPISAAQAFDFALHN